TNTSAAVSTTAAAAVPLAAVSRLETGATPLSINHQGLFAATTISFNLAPGEALGNATTAINRAVEGLHLPLDVHGSFQGTAKVYQESLADEPVLIATALLAIYIVLGILYESYVHPVTILSTLPSAGVGALLALMLFHVPFSIMALIGVLLLIGIVKKNAIMMVDVAIASERQGMTPDEAIFHACLLRFRPIMMTTLVALFSALPLAFGIGEGAEIRVPLGISIVGGLIVSQILTLYTTPVVYLYLEELRRWFNVRLGQSPDLALPDLQGETP
ncbi:MAG: efflux RND transporter permease subunit, partial [Alphaproteobacteria bacterium]|nr:efflux RND transporter permease subunit [Alphaproteobacteria bacterium]